MRFVLILFINILFSTSYFSVQAQVGKAKERARESKSDSRSSNSSGIFGSSSSDNGSTTGNDLLIQIAGDFILLPLKALYLGQADQLYFAHVDDWRISFEGRIPVGYDPLQNVTLLQPQVRGNWGLFSTQFRYNRIFDNTGVLSTFDWQIIQFNFINHEFVRWVVGMGFSKEIEIDQTHFEGSSSLTIFLANRVWAPTLEYRISGNGTPRQEFSALVNYQPNNENQILNTFSGGF